MAIIDYNMQNPMDAFFKTAGGLQQLQANNQQYEANQLAMQQQQQQQQAAAQQQERIQSLLPKVQSGDYKAAIELATVSPQLSEAINKAKAGMREGQDRATADWIAGYQSAPDKEAYLASDNQAIDIDDQFRRLPPEQRDVLTKIVGAQVMPEQMFNATFGQQMTEFQSADLDIKRENTKLRAMEAEARRAEQALASETNELKRQELQAKVDEKNLKVQEQRQKFESAANEKKAELTNAIGAASDTVAIVDRILTSPGFSAAVGAKDASSLFGLIKNPIAGTPAADTAALIDTLDAKNFLIAIQQMKGMGALSNAEGEKLSRAVQSLSRDQTEVQLKRNLEEIKAITSRAVETVRARTGADKNNAVDAKPLQQRQAPQQAIDYLMQNPQFKEQFRAKYGYLPEGV